MSQKIREILIKTFGQTSWEGQGGTDILTMGKEVLLNVKQIDEAHQAIISAILEKMPKEKNLIIYPDKTDNATYITGYNRALAEMRERIRGI